MATKTSKLFIELRRQRLPPLPSVRDLIRLYQLTAIKQLSQNFLLDQKLTSKIVKAAGDVSNCLVCEVGPGPGGITRSILERGPRHVVLIEKDKRFETSIKMLENACPGKISVFWGDVLSFEMSKIFPQDLQTPWDGPLPKIHLIGNLPFSISTPLVTRWLANISERNNAWSLGRVPLTLTFQKEVAERLTADASSEHRSRLSIMAQYLTHASLKFIINGSAFVPKPDVDVGVVKFVPRKEPLISQPFPLVEKVVKRTFCMRQKYSCRPISTLFPMMARQHFTKVLFEMSFVFPNTRPFDLTIEDFQRLCDAYAQIIQTYPEIGEYNYRLRRADYEWELLHASKYEAFRSNEKPNQKTYCHPKQIKPLDVISSELALECENEMFLEEMDKEDVIFV